MAAYGCQTYVGLGRTPIPNGPAVTPAPVSIIKNHMWRQYRPGRLLHHCAAMRALLCASLKAGKVALLSGRVGPTCRSRFAPMGPTLCARLDDPYGSLNARVWPQGGTFGRARPPLRQVLLQCHSCLADLPQPLGCCHGPEPRRSSTRPVWRPGRRVSASGDCFWRRCPYRKTR